jgi:hypothetical protein
MISSFFDKITTLTKERREGLEKQRVEEAQKKTADLLERKRLKEEKVTHKRFRELEDRLSGKRAGRPKKEKISSIVTIKDSTVYGNVTVNQYQGCPSISSTANSSSSSSSRSSSLDHIDLLYSSDHEHGSEEDFEDAHINDTTDQISGETSNERNISSSPPASWSALGLVDSKNIKGPNIKREPYFNWVLDYNLFEQIITCVKNTTSFSEAIRELQGIRYPSIMSKLSRTNLYSWFDKNRNLRKNVKERWLARKPAKRGIKKKYALSFEPRLEYLLFKIFQQRRKDELPVNSIIGVSIMKSVITQYKPKLLEEMSLSRRWVRQWLRGKCAFSYKRATTSGQKLAIDWKVKVATMVDRAAANVKVYGIKHPSLVINWDQSRIDGHL